MLTKHHFAKPKYSQRHGGPYDRGSADSCYRRPYDPHFYVGATYSSTRIGYDRMTNEEIAAYKQGWDDNEASGYHKG